MHLLVEAIDEVLNRFWLQLLDGVMSCQQQLEYVLSIGVEPVDALTLF